MSFLENFFIFLTLLVFYYLASMISRKSYFTWHTTADDLLFAFVFAGSYFIVMYTNITAVFGFFVWSFLSLILINYLGFRHLRYHRREIAKYSLFAHLIAYFFIFVTLIILQFLF